MTDPRRTRWPYFGAQPILLLCGLVLVLGAFLPWALVLGQSLRASPLAVSWTLWAALVTIAASIVRWRTVAVVSALGGGGTAVALAVWQTARIFDRCPLTLECLPGPGVGILIVAGTLALYGAFTVARTRAGAR